MTPDDLIEEVKDAIGEGEDDKLIDPRGHRDLYAEQAPAIARVLGSSTVRATVEQKDQAEHPAATAQRDFKKQSNLAAWLVVVAATASALIMAMPTLLTDSGAPSRQFLSLALALAGFAAATGAATLLRIIQGNRLLEKWMESRAMAETKRLEYFAKVSSAPLLPSEDPARSRLEQLEYFRRYQLDGQIRYYKRAIERHEKAAARAATRSAAAIGLAGFANAAAGMLGVWRPELAAVAGLGVVAQSVGSKLTNDEAIGQDSRNAERYGRTLHALIGLQGRLDEVRAGVARGNEKALPAFVEAVQEQLSLEHRQWLAGREDMDAALGRLKQALDTTKEALVPGGAEADAADGPVQS